MADHAGTKHTGTPALSLHHLHQLQQAGNYFATNSMPLESPLLLPNLPVEPSPTTGIQHLIPPLFQGSTAWQAAAGQPAVSREAIAAAQIPSPVRKKT
eukprot:GHRR01025700.1.p2 GENE.GHRR01025700.1~~GHRR01025700.1.p2  ORF type:complete len:111 (+),score=17.71 GHRR01025700.1:41-334(+)